MVQLPSFWSPAWSLQAMEPCSPCWNAVAVTSCCSNSDALGDEAEAEHASAIPSYSEPIFGPNRLPQKEKKIAKRQASAA